MNKKKIIISGINLFEGGPLSIIKDVLKYLNESKFHQDFQFIALVHKKSLFTNNCFRNIDFIEFPKSRNSYFNRLYYEYIYFKSLSKKIKPYFWLSLHDITPNVGIVQQAVYCHNPSPFNSLNFKDIFLQPTQFFFRLFYKYLYKINIKKNKYVVVQQMWIKHKFISIFNLKPNKIITALPEVPKIDNKYFTQFESDIEAEHKRNKIFFFPTYPRPFKNIEIIGEALRLLPYEVITNIEILITIDGSENTYAKSIIEKYKDIKSIKFIGLINREEVFEYYSKSDVLIFPSKLETWGLPISEFKQFNKPMFVSNLPYAKETVGNYNYVNFFDPDNPKALRKLILDFMNNSLSYSKTSQTNYIDPKVNDWEELFDILLK